MIFGIALLTLALAAAGWGGYEAVRHWRGNRAIVRQAAQARQDAANARIREHTTDHIQWFRNQWARDAGALEKERLARVADAQAAQSDTAEVVKAFPGEKAPNLSSIIWIAILCGTWIVAAITQFGLDLPIIANINGGNLPIGLLGTMVFVSVPIAASIGLKWLAGLRRDGRLTPMAFRASVAGMLAILAASIAIMVGLAPLRAENEYAEPIRITEQSRIMFLEDGDTTGVEFADVKLAQLRQQRQQSADFNQVAILLTSTLEFGTGFAVPTGYLIVTLMRAKRREKDADTEVTKATNARDDHGARELQELSNQLMQADVPQARIREALAEIAGQAGDGPTGAPAGPAGPAGTPGSSGAAGAGRPTPGAQRPADREPANDANGSYPMPAAAPRPEPVMVDHTAAFASDDRTFDQS